MGNWESCFVILPRPTARGLTWGRCERLERLTYAEYGTDCHDGWEYRPRGSSSPRGANSLVAGLVWLIELALLVAVGYWLLPVRP